VIRKLLALIPIFAYLASCSAEERMIATEESTIKLVLPKSAIAVYAVPIDEVPLDLKAAFESSVKNRSEGRSREIALSFLARAETRIEVWEKDNFPDAIVSILRSMQPSKKNLEIFEKNRRNIVITCIGKPGFPPVHDYAGRLCAASLAADRDSCVVDVYSPKLLSPDDALHSVPNMFKDPDFRDWIRVLHSSWGSGLWMTTRGLGRLGLPEIQTIDAPPQLDEPWSYVMATLAWKIVKLTRTDAGTENGGLKTEIPSKIQLSAEDLLEVYGDIFDNYRPKPIEIYLKMSKGRNGDDYLTVAIPRTEKIAFGEYLVLQSKRFMGGIDRTILVEPSDKLKKAMAEARAGLPAVRKRFLNDELTPGGQLLVKFRVANGANHEYLWAYITSWKSPDELKGYCGNDSDADPKIRAGQPIVLKTNEIFDWGVFLDEKFVEGGLTAKILEH